MRKPLTIPILGVALLGLLGCSKQDPSQTTIDAQVTPRDVLTNYANLVHANYADSLLTAEALKAEIVKFVEAPSAESLTACREAWLAAREPYGQTEAFRFAQGPIDDEDGPEALLNAWPLDEQYVDYVREMPAAGIINKPDRHPTIDAALLESLNEQGGETNVATGYHAVEFLLWGQDDPDVTLKTPGQRPHTDYLDAANSDRRKTYLVAATDLLLSHLADMVDAWAPDKPDNYRATFLAMDPNEAIANVMTGIATLSKAELAGERMFVALDNQDQEDEHSCFSDNTHRDVATNAQGIANVYTGTYKRVDGTTVTGPSLHDLISQQDAAVADAIQAANAESLRRATAIPAPFDFSLTQEKVGGQGPILACVKILRKQGDQLAAGAQALGIQIGTDLPE